MKEAKRLWSWLAIPCIALAVLTGSSLTTLPQALGSMFTPLTAFVFLTFTLLYTPCVAAIATVRRELSAKHALAMALWQCVLAWAVAFVVYQLLNLML